MSMQYKLGNKIVLTSPGVGVAESLAGRGLMDVWTIWLWTAWGAVGPSCGWQESACVLHEHAAATSMIDCDGDEAAHG